MNLAAMVRLLRPHQYIKNLLVFAAPGAAGRLDESAVLGWAVVAFVLFCAVSSIGYVTNDLADVDRDRKHPRKKHRPIASGAVTPTQAQVIRGLLIVAVIATLVFLPVQFAILLLGYWLLTTCYSLGLKTIPWIELLAVASGFVIRAVAGGAIVDLRISGWFLAVVSSSALLLICGKRLGELVKVGADSGARAVLHHYAVPDLQFTSAVLAGIGIGAYVAWTNGRSAEIAGSFPWLIMVTAVPFSAALLRFARLAWRGEGEQPDLLVVRDRVVVAAATCWALLYALGLYL